MHIGSWIMSLDGDLRAYERGKGVRIMCLSQFISVTLSLRCLYIIKMKTNDHWTTTEMGLCLKKYFLHAFPAMTQKILTFFPGHWLHFVSLRKSNISVICTFDDAYLVSVQINVSSNWCIHTFGTLSFTSDVSYVLIF